MAKVNNNRSGIKIVEDGNQIVTKQTNSVQWIPDLFLLPLSLLVFKASIVAS